MQGDVGTCDEQANVGLIFRLVTQEFLVGCTRNQHKFGIFQSIDVVSGRFGGKVAEQIRDRSAFDGKLYDVLVYMLIDRIGA